MRRVGGRDEALPGECGEVLEEVLVTPGTHPIDVSFTPDESSEVTPNAPRYHLTQPIDFHAGRVCVVTLKNPERATSHRPRTEDSESIFLNSASAAV